MFYTGVISSLLPYLLLLAVFSTVLLNKISTYSKTSNNHAKQITFQINKAGDQSGYSNYYFRKHHTDDRSCKIPPQAYLQRSLDLCCDRINQWYPPDKIALLNDPWLNHPLSYRGPPKFY